MPEVPLFIHGWATDGAVWKSVAARISPEQAGGLGRLKVTLPGHGGKGRWLEPTIAPAVRAVEEALEGRDPVVGIGWSLGGQALLKAAARRPHAFSALVLVGATPRFVATVEFPSGQPRALVKRMITDMKKDPSATIDRFYSLNFTEEELKTEAARDFIARYRYPGPVVCSDGVDSPPGCYPAFDYGGITTALESLYSTDLRGELEKIRTPALVIHGERDEVCPVGAGRYLAENIQGAELKIIEDAGHAPFLTASDQFIEAVKDFINRV